MFRRILDLCVVGLLVVMVGCGLSGGKGEKERGDAAIERSKVGVAEVKRDRGSDSGSTTNSSLC